MFRIRRIYDDVLPVDRDAIRQVQEILTSAIEGVSAQEVAAIPERLRDPFRQRFLTRLFVAERTPGRVQGCAVVFYEPQLRFLFLDLLASARRAGGGVGGALYQRVKEEALALESRGLFFECLPDDPALCPRPEKLAANAARLRFYEGFGARPIVGTGYETPVSPEDDCPPLLVYDGLGSEQPLRRDFARRVVRAVLERKYGDLCPPEYVEMVVASFREDPVRLREPRYVKAPPLSQTARTDRAPGPIRMVVNDRHDIHHVRERGYVESPVRVASLLRQLDASGLFERIEPRSYPESWIRAVHDPALVDYLFHACAEVPEGKSVYPYVFPIRNAARPPRDLSLRAGYWCIDTFTPINRNAWPAARRAVDCTLTAANEILDGRRFAYALVRPPGHHAERRLFGGFCYFNNAAVAAHYLSAHGRIAILDVDYHHGNGQQEIFYERDDVLTVSIHGHPQFAYPYFSGFEDECGTGPGEGFNLNLPLPESVDGAAYRQTLERALRAVEAFRPLLLVVCLGLDPAKGDPTGTWSLTARDFEANGRMIGGLRLPTLVVQEGGYRTRTLGVNARHFFEGFLAGARLR